MMQVELVEKFTEKTSCTEEFAWMGLEVNRILAVEAERESSFGRRKDISLSLENLFVLGISEKIFVEGRSST